METIRLTITDRDSAVKALRAEHAFTHLISIRDAMASRPIEGYDRVPRRVALFFDDVTIPREGYQIVSPVNIRQILEFAEHRVDKSKLSEVSVLVNCEAGISRSTAAAYIFLAAIGGSGREAEALAMVVNARAQAVPTARMIELADTEMSCGGALVAALEAYTARFLVGKR